MAYLPLPDQPDDLLCVGQHRIAGKAGHDRAAAVHPGHRVILGVAAAFQRLFNDRGEILVVPDVGQLRVGHHRRREHTVTVALPHRHQTVRCEQDGRGDVVEL